MAAAACAVPRVVGFSFYTTTGLDYAAVPEAMAGVEPFWDTGLNLVTAASDASGPLRFVVRKDDFIGHFLGVSGQWERPFQQAVFSLMDTLSSSDDGSIRGPPLWLDIGANVGVWSIAAARHLTSSGGGSVVSFEPQQDLVNILGANLLLNGCGNVQVINAFVSNSTAPSEISRVESSSSSNSNSSDSSSSSSSSSDSTKKQTNYGAFSKRMLEASNVSEVQKFSYKIPNLRLDDLFVHRNGMFEGSCPQFIKMDIEAAELEALFGGTDMLRSCRPVLFIEAECKWQFRSMFGFLDALGYTLAWVLLPSVDPFFNHYSRVVENTYENLMQLYMSRNIVAVRREQAEVLQQKPFFALIDLQGERKINPNTWHSLDDRDINICHMTSEKCFTWRMALEEPTYKSDPDRNIFYCNGDQLIDEEQVFLYKTF